MIEHASLEQLATHTTMALNLKTEEHMFNYGFSMIIWTLEDNGTLMCPLADLVIFVKMTAVDEDLGLIRHNSRYGQ